MSSETGTRVSEYTSTGGRTRRAVNGTTPRSPGIGLGPDGRYVPIPIDRIGENVLRGYSEVLDLYVCWEYGALRFFDHAEGRYLLTYGRKTFVSRSRPARTPKGPARTPPKNARGGWRSDSDGCKGRTAPSPRDSARLGQVLSAPKA